MLGTAWRSYKRAKDANSHYSVLNNAYLLVSVILGGASTAGSLAGLVFSYVSGFWAAYGWAGTIAVALTFFLASALVGTFIALLLAIGGAREVLTGMPTTWERAPDRAVALLGAPEEDTTREHQEFLLPATQLDPVEFAFASGGFGLNTPFRCGVQEPNASGQQEIYEDLWIRLSANNSLRNTRVVILAETTDRRVQLRWEPEADFRGEVNPGEYAEFHISRRVIDRGHGIWVLPQGPNQPVGHDYISFQVTAFHADGPPIERRFRVWFRPGWVPFSTVSKADGIETIDSARRILDTGAMFLSGYQ